MRIVELNLSHSAIKNDRSPQFCIFLMVLIIIKITRVMIMIYIKKFPQHDEFLSFFIYGCLKDIISIFNFSKIIYIQTHTENMT